MKKDGGAFHGDIETTGCKMIDYYAAHAPDFNVMISGRPEDQIRELVRLRWLYAQLMVEEQLKISPPRVSS